MGTGGQGEAHRNGLSKRTERPDLPPPAQTKQTDFQLAAVLARNGGVLFLTLLARSCLNSQATDSIAIASSHPYTVGAKPTFFVGRYRLGVPSHCVSA